MTDKEAMKLALEALELLTDTEQTFGALDYGDNAITALKERLAQPEQEPVALHIGWLVRNSQGKLDLLTELQIDSSLEKYERLHKLYTTPPQRTWVGLTDEEFHEACWESYVDPVTGECSTGDREYAVRWTEAKLKEKNT